MTCERCGGTGKLRYTIPADPTPIHVGDGVTITQGQGSGTRACPCVRDLPPVEGDATWWESETVYSAVMAECIYPDDCFEVSASAEVPRNEDGRRVVRRGNRYYPTLIEFAGPTHTTLHAYAARQLGEQLIAAADAADAIDGPCADLCGHWFPCGCVAEAVGKALAPVLGVEARQGALPL